MPDNKACNRQKTVAAMHSEHGSTMLETILALALFGAFMILVSGYVSMEREQQFAKTLGITTAYITQAVQNYVGNEYDTIRQDLFTRSSRDLKMAVAMGDIAGKGYLPAAVIQNGLYTNAAGQNYTLLLRGVNSNDSSSPQDTLTRAQADGNSDGKIDAQLVDGDQRNGELELEAILMTSQGEDIDPQVGGKVMAGAEMYSVGYVEKDGVARGSYGVWELDTSPYDGMSGYDGTKALVSLIALSRNGVFGYPGTARENDDSNTYLDRCENSIGSVLTACEKNNEIFTEVVFNSFDDDGDGVPDFYGRIKNLYTLEMGSAVDSDGDSVPDMHGVITNLGGIGCGNTTSSPSHDTLTVDCRNVEFSENVAINNDLTINNQLRVGGNLIGDSAIQGERFLADALAGQDLTKGIYHVDLIPMNQSKAVPKPVCQDDDSSPEIFVTPASFVIPGGYPVIGVRGEATDSNMNWIVDMKAIIDRDDNGDGNADVIPLTSASDLVQVLIRCS